MGEENRGSECQLEGRGLCINFCLFTSQAPVSLAGRICWKQALIRACVPTGRRLREVLSSLGDRHQGYGQDKESCQVCQDSGSNAGGKVFKAFLDALVGFQNIFFAVPKLARPLYSISKYLLNAFLYQALCLALHVSRDQRPEKRQREK